MKKRNIVLILVLFLVLTWLVSCKKNQGYIPLGEQELPDMVMHNATYTFGEKNRRPLTMKAQTITIFSGENGRTILENTTFTQEETGTDGEKYTELSGTCDKATVNSANSEAKLSGNVRLEKKSDKFVIFCDNLSWNDDNQVISTDSEVYVSYDDGTTLKAVGFSAMLDDNSYEFGRIIEGRFTSEN